MKKFLFIFTLVLSMVFLGSCYYDERKDIMQVDDIKVFDKQGNEVYGEFENSRNLLLNSAAPVMLVYRVDVDPEEEYKVLFYLSSKKNYKISSLKIQTRISDKDTTFSEREYEFFESSDIRDNGKEQIVSFTINNILNYKNPFVVKSWNSDKGQTYSFGVKGSNTYKMGVMFVVSNKENLELLNY